MDDSGRAELGVRVAGIPDAEEIVALVESAYRGESSRAGWTTEADLLDGQRTDATSVRNLIGRLGNEILLAKRGSRIIGCCHLALGDEGTVDLGLFAVRPEMQGGGVGRWLIGEAERRAKELHRASRLRMSVLWQRLELIAWYERLGYEATGERVVFPYGDERFGRPRRADLEFIVLEKNLKA
jgi:GNAT superfamily N-acetyltransferase